MRRVRGGRGSGVGQHAISVQCEQMREILSVALEEKPAVVGIDAPLSFAGSLSGIAIVQ